MWLCLGSRPIARVPGALEVWHVHVDVAEAGRWLDEGRPLLLLLARGKLQLLTYTTRTR